MPKSQSKKRTRDAVLHASWEARPDGDFQHLGLTRDQIKALQAQLQGSIVLPGDPTYDQDKLLSNPAFNPAPSMIVYCKTEADVRVALSAAQSAPMPFTVRSGGHCTAGFSSGYGVLIDVSGLDSIYIDTTTMQAIVGAGCNWGAFDQQLGLYNVHVPGGECADVCIGGYVQGGGIGFTSTTFGMNCDNVLALRVMLHDGSIVQATPTVNPDLWWAMRGGTGGNFGILLSVTYQLHALDDVFGFALAWPCSTASDIQQVVNVLMLLQQKYMQDSPFWPQLTLQALWVYQTIIDPTQPPLPAPVPVFMVRGLWVGDPDGAARAMKPLQAMSGCVTQWTKTASYTTVLDALLGCPQDQPIIDPTMGMPNEDKGSRYVARDLQASEWTSLVTYFVDQSPSTLSYMYLELYGGAIATYPMDKSAFIHRDAFYNAVLDVFWYRPNERQAAETYLTGWINLMETFWNNEVYQNYASVDVPNYVENYWGAAAHGLGLVKSKYDQPNAFQFAQQVPPVTRVRPDASVPASVAAALSKPIDYTGGVAPAAARPR